MKVLLPVDGSEYTKRMLAYVAAHEELFGPSHEYVFFTAVPPIPGHAARFLDRKVIDEYHAEQAEAVLKPVREFAAQQKWTARFAHGTGHAADAIARYAEAEKPALIVMGAHGHSALAATVLGSVTTGVLARCKTAPVLLVR